MKSTLGFGSSFLLLCSTLVGQGSSSDQLLTFVRTSNPASNYVATQDMDNGCKAGQKIFGTLTGAGGTYGNGGGAAYDASTDTAWISDGARIRSQDRTGKTLCDLPATLSGAGWVVTGLAFNAPKRQLIQLEMGPDLNGRGTSMNVRLYDTKTCPPVALPLACSGLLINGTGASAAGIAYDQERDLLYYSESISGFVAWDTTIHVARLAAPCTDINTTTPIKITNCGSRGNPVSGLGYGHSSRQLYVTFGAETRVLLMSAPSIGIVTDLTTQNHGGKCCASGLVTGDAYHGLTVLPGFDSKAVGSSCLGAGCQTCNSMALSTVGAAVIGNPDFAFSVSGAPMGSVAIFYISLGNCSGTGVMLPGLCGPVLTPIGGVMPVSLASLMLGGVQPCTGSTNLRTAIPLDRTLCQVALCTQWLVLCVGGSGAGLTNAVEIQFGG